MIKHSIITSPTGCIALTHSQSGEFIGIAHCSLDNQSKMMQIDTLVTRYDSEMLLLGAIGGYATSKGFRVRPNPDKKRSKNRDREEVSRWNAMVTLPEYGASIIPELALRDDLSLGLRYSYQIPSSERTQRHTSEYSTNDMPMHVNRALELGERIVEHVANSSTTVFIEDEYPLPPANPSTGENVFCGYQLKDVVETYTSGKCMFLALALSERFGFDVDMHISKYQGNWMIEHAWCRNGTDGIDINGVQANYHWDGIGSLERSVTKDQVFSLMEKSGEYPGFTLVAGEQAILDAHKVIDSYLLDHHIEIARCQPNHVKETPEILQMTI